MTNINYVINIGSPEENSTQDRYGLSVVWAPEQKVEWLLDYSLSIKASFCETPNQVPSIDARAVQQHADSKTPHQILSLYGSLRFFAESDNLSYCPRTIPPSHGRIPLYWTFSKPSPPGHYTGCP